MSQGGQYKEKWGRGISVNATSFGVLSKPLARPALERTGVVGELDGVYDVDVPAEQLEGERRCLVACGRTVTVDEAAKVVSIPSPEVDASSSVAGRPSQSSRKPP